MRCPLELDVLREVPADEFPAEKPRCGASTRTMSSMWSVPNRQDSENARRYSSVINLFGPDHKANTIGRPVMSVHSAPRSRVSYGSGLV